MPILNAKRQRMEGAKLFSAPLCASASNFNIYLTSIETPKITDYTDKRDMRCVLYGFCAIMLSVGPHRLEIGPKELPGKFGLDLSA